LNHLIPDGTDLLVIPQDVYDVRRLPVFLLQFGQFLVDFLILGGPLFTILGFQYVKLGVVDDIRPLIVFGTSRSRPDTANKK
jgi:hypothetical protein